MNNNPTFDCETNCPYLTGETPDDRCAECIRDTVGDNRADECRDGEHAN